MLFIRGSFRFVFATCNTLEDFVRMLKETCATQRKYIRPMEQCGETWAAEIAAHRTLHALGIRHARTWVVGSDTSKSMKSFDILSTDSHDRLLLPFHECA